MAILCCYFQVCKIRHLLTLRSELSNSEHDLSSTYSSVRSDDSACSEEGSRQTESESLIDNGKTDKVHEILDKVSSSKFQYTLIFVFY